MLVLGSFDIEELNKDFCDNFPTLKETNLCDCKLLKFFDFVVSDLQV